VKVYGYCNAIGHSTTECRCGWRRALWIGNALAQPSYRASHRESIDWTSGFAKQTSCIITKGRRCRSM
jgi:hypothetical protein